MKCYDGQINQVFMNGLANVLDALDESHAGKTFEEIKKAPNRITIETKLSEDDKSIIAVLSSMRYSLKANPSSVTFQKRGVKP
ncbi:hypothetical protein [Roseofilum sp. Belize Diploria]|uniref:hypothetical protein n=2 Tax=unclassified Roseofilum TaxID=2620099 RepID=UPI00298E2B81|nr:hypothetical protein [Roseofilum sp. Belize Diploria]